MRETELLVRPHAATVSRIASSVGMVPSSRSRTTVIRLTLAKQRPPRTGAHVTRIIVLAVSGSHTRTGRGDELGPIGQPMEYAPPDPFGDAVSSAVCVFF